MSEHLDIFGPGFPADVRAELDSALNEISSSCDGFSLKDIQQESGRFERHLDCEDQSGISLSPPRFNIQIEGTDLIVTISMATRYTLEPGQVALSIEAAFVITYQHPDGLADFDRRLSHRFACVDGLHNTWPLWREFLLSSMARAHLPPHPIPLLRSWQSAYLAGLHERDS